MEKTRPDTKRKKEEAHGDEKIHPTKEDLFDKGQSLRESHDEDGIVVTPKNPESQEWHAREDVKEERQNP